VIGRSRRDAPEDTRGRTAVAEPVLPAGGRRWRLIRDGEHTAAWNMAVDEALLHGHAAGKSPPVLRLYGWCPPALSIGYFQRWAQEVNEAGCRARGFDWVRRPTGGRALLHQHELTYSVAVREDLLPGSVLETYCALSQGLLAGFQRLGLTAHLAAGQGHRQIRGLSAACFDSPSAYELTVEGKKIVGSAQTRREGCILQHGSILLDLDVDALCDCLLLTGEGTRARMRRLLHRRATSLGQVLEKPPSPEEVAGAMADGFASALKLVLCDSTLYPWEEEEAQRLMEEKYLSPAWNKRR